MTDLAVLARAAGAAVMSNHRTGVLVATSLIALLRFTLAGVALRTKR